MSETLTSCRYVSTYANLLPFLPHNILSWITAFILGNGVDSPVFISPLSRIGQNCLKIEKVVQLDERTIENIDLGRAYCRENNLRKFNS
jgi:hypothetical protein